MLLQNRCMGDGRVALLRTPVMAQTSFPHRVQSRSDGESFASTEPMMGHWGTLLSYKTPVWGGASFASTNPRLGQVRDALLQNPRKGVWSPSESTVQKYEDGGGGGVAFRFYRTAVCVWVVGGIRFYRNPYKRRAPLRFSENACKGRGPLSLLQNPRSRKGRLSLPENPWLANGSRCASAEHPHGMVGLSLKQGPVWGRGALRFYRTLIGGCAPFASTEPP